ncbi:MAG: ScyD/ScyE family protein [Saprospiraceae bacterium]
MKKLVLLSLLALLISATLSAQLSVLTDSLDSPIGIKADEWGNIWVSNSGTGNNDGSIMLVTKRGKKYPAIKGLPSGVNPDEGDIVGPWHAIPMDYGKMAVLIGGKSTLGPDFGKLLFFDMAGFKAGDPAKTMADTTTSFNVGAFGLATSLNNDSDPFNAVQDEDGVWYITDAAANDIIRVSRNGKNMSVFARFGGVPNPTPVGPPVVDAVPTGIIALPKYGGFLVSTLTGFPFNKGAAAIYKVDRLGNISTYLSGLTMITDLSMDRFGTIYANQFGTFTLPGGFDFGSGQIIRIRKQKIIDTIAQHYGPGSGLTLYQDRKFYVTDLFTGRVLGGDIPAEKLDARSLTLSPGVEVNLAPNPVADNLTIQWNNVAEGAAIQLQLTDITGKVIYKKENLDPVWPQHKINVSKYNAGTYILTLNINNQIVSKKVNIVK